MRRLAILVATFVALVGAGGLASDIRFGSAAVEAGREAYPHRQLLSGIRRPLRGRPPVAWLGDSTLLGAQDVPSYPAVIATRLRRPDTLIVATQGLDAFAAYFLMASLTEREPHGIVLIANPRLLTNGTVRSVSDLSAELPLGELPWAALLPIYARGITVPRLILDRAWRWAWAERAAYWVVGMRHLWQSAPLWKVLGSSEYPPAVRGARWARSAWTVRRKFVDPIGERTPQVRMLGAAVRLATSRGVPVLVVVTPIPWQPLQQAGLYDRDRFAERIAALRRVVEGSGGSLLDLHSGLAAGEFRDHTGHYSQAGVERMIRYLGPRVARLAAGLAPL